jgi:hypothetical protein
MQVTSTLLIITVYFTFIHVDPQIQAQITGDWRLVIDRNDVKVHIHHCPEQNARAYRATATIYMGLDSLEKILDQVEDYPKWQESVREARIVYRSSDSRYHYYSRNRQGWPAKDRDLMWAVEKTWDQATATLVYDMVCSTNTLPEKNNNGIAAQAFVSWRLQPISETEVRVSCNLTIQQGGRIPNWLLTMLDAESPYQTLSRLKSFEIQGDGTIASLD